MRVNVACSWEKPIKPVMHLADENAKEILDGILRDLEQKGVQDLVILTSGTFEYSAIYDYLRFSADPRDGYAYYPFDGKEYKVTTCIRFKGLESDAIILIDLHKDSFIGKKA